MRDEHYQRGEGVEKRQGSSHPGDRTQAVSHLRLNPIKMRQKVMTRSLKMLLVILTVSVLLSLSHPKLYTLTIIHRSDDMDVAGFLCEEKTTTQGDTVITASSGSLW